MVFRGMNAVAAGRILLGSTDPMKADLGTVWKEITGQLFT
jgi:nucleoside diphosphate kinase